MDSIGSIVVQVVTALGAVPLSDASVTITQGKGEEREIIAYRITDRSGKTQAVDLTAPPLEVSRAPGFPSPFALCDIEIYKQSYYNVIINDAQVFSERVTLQQTELIPEEEYPLPGRRANIVYTEPQNL